MGRRPLRAKDDVRDGMSGVLHDPSWMSNVCASDIYPHGRAGLGARILDLLTSDPSVTTIKRSWGEWVVCS